MAFIFANPNPQKNLVGDCVVRAIALVTNQSWDDTFLDLMVHSYMLKDMPSSNYVWSTFLHELGFERKVIPNTCPDCYTISDFSNDYPNGNFIVATGTHVVAVKDGNYYDTWDSGNEIPIFYWKREG